VQLFLVVVRLLIAITAVQMTGIPHVIADVVMAVHSNGNDQPLTDDDCPEERDGHECPPGCPNCHCAHPVNALPVLPASFLLELPSFEEIAIAPYDAQAPPKPDLGAVYRPPRTGRA
jgi:hypothetical protein